MERINEWLYTGGKTTKAAIAHNKIKYVINISGIPAEYKVDSVIKVADRGSNNDPKQFIEILKEMDNLASLSSLPIFDVSCWRFQKPCGCSTLSILLP